MVYLHHSKIEFVKLLRLSSRVGLFAKKMLELVLLNEKNMDVMIYHVMGGQESPWTWLEYCLVFLDVRITLGYGVWLYMTAAPDSLPSSTNSWLALKNMKEYEWVQLSLFGMEYLRNPHEYDQTLFHPLLIPILSFSIDSFPIEMYGFMGLCVYIDPVHGLTKMGKNSICLCHSMSLFLFTYGIATPFGSIH